MKKIFFLFILIPFLGFSQVQIGLDINGANVNDFFGSFVSLNDDGNIIAIGATGNNSGCVKVYENVNDEWIQLGQNIFGENFNDNFGGTVDLSSDGMTLAVSARLNDEIADNSGQVRVYENLNGSWVQLGNSLNGETNFDEFGSSISLSSDGTILAIGSRNFDNNNSGEVEIFQLVNDNWIQIGLDINGEFSNDLANTVSLSSNGSIIAIGATANLGSGFQSGHVRIYENQNNTWVQIGSDIDGEAESDFSGTVSLSSDGSIVAIGAFGNDGSGNFSGHVRVFENISNNWVQKGDDINGESEGDWSGRSVKLSSNGTILAIGAQFNDGNGDNSGHVRIYQYNSGNWSQIGIDIDGDNENDEFGRRVTLSAVGDILAVSSTQNDDNGTNSGHVRVYDLTSALSTNDNYLSSFNIFPNPTNNQFTIQLKNNSTLKNLNIYNNLGQLVLSSKKTIIDTSKFNSGLYIVEIETSKGKSSKNLIIQ
jgi:hypothetical protein